MPLPKYGPPGTPEYRAYQREWNRLQMMDPEVRKRRSKIARASQKRHPIKHALILYRNSARRRGLAYEIHETEIARMLQVDCYYCGAKPNPINGIDRKDNALGYVEGNVVTACRACNIAKLDRSMDEFRAWLLRLMERIQEW